MRAIISRFAPAPTGLLHLGHVVNAVTVWSETRARGGRVLLRIEDHDRQRSQSRFEVALLEDLAWLGFEADGPPVRQSARGDVYAHALDTLRAKGLVYACDCTRAEIDQRAARRDGDRDDVGARLREPGIASELRYRGTCRHRGLHEGPGIGVRVRLDPSTERFVDLRMGPQEQQPFEQCGDVLVRDRDGNWTYQFAAAVDDYVQGVTLVIRGRDLLASTGRQIQLARLLGRQEPATFLHHALIMKSPDQKLSKSDGDTGISELRARGWTAAQVIDHALALVASDGA